MTQKDILQILRSSVLISLSFSLGIPRVHSNFFVILLQGSHVLPGLGELSLLHSLSHVPVNKSSLPVHEVKLDVEPAPGRLDGGGVGDHADTAGHLGQAAL